MPIFPKIMPLIWVQVYSFLGLLTNVLALNSFAFI